MNYRYLPFILAIPAILTGCAHVKPPPINPVPADRIENPSENIKNPAELTITHLGAYGGGPYLDGHGKLGVRCRLAFLIDGQRVAKFLANESATFLVSPGKHVLHFVNDWEAKEGEGCEITKEEALSKGKAVTVNLWPNTKHAFSVKKEGPISTAAAVTAAFVPLLGQAIVGRTMDRSKWGPAYQTNVSFVVKDLNNKLFQPDSRVDLLPEARGYLTPSPKSAKVTISNATIPADECIYALYINEKMVARMPTDSAADFYLPSGNNTLAYSLDETAVGNRYCRVSKLQKETGFITKDSHEFIANKYYEVKLKTSGWTGRPTIDVDMVNK